MTFYDIVLDFILMDAFDDLENPPSSVIAVIQNRWLSNSFKETVSPHLVTDSSKWKKILSLDTLENIILFHIKIIVF